MLDCNTLKETHPSVPGACLGAYDSTGRAVWKLCAEYRRWGRRDFYRPRATWNTSILTVDPPS